jgi:hypothetical protein
VILCLLEEGVEEDEVVGVDADADEEEILAKEKHKDCLLTHKEEAGEFQM